MQKVTNGSTLNGKIYMMLQLLSSKKKYVLMFGSGGKEKPQAIQHNASIYFELSKYYRKFKDIKTYDDV